jgi:hypothetical protein
VALDLALAILTIIFLALVMSERMQMAMVVALETVKTVGVVAVQVVGMVTAIEFQMGRARLAA